ncbi:MAG TPA: hypothetical protein VMC03_07880 [Streptosporangiaceae bacterium]|nr:hypothetical protein [Streptosporangiaceae bacterium]
MNENNEHFDIGDYPRPRRPWFGPKRFGSGYGPRTWQGWLVTAVLVAFAIVVATLTKGHMPLVLIGVIPALAVPLLIMAIQRR